MKVVINVKIIYCTMFSNAGLKQVLYFLTHVTVEN